ncbi:MAG: hypothetical protein DBY43_06665 [Clostridiaceae bacterium]|jgi:hypothetical protein|nr:MAG: hypothetical protein DBY43_06665 [Clostridiaceae bacterium]
MNNTRASKKVSASKKGLIVIFASAILTTIAIVVLTVQGTSDLSTLGEVCVALWTAAGAYSAFYLWKSKVENKCKYSQQFLDQMAEKYGIENIIPLLQSILED